MGHITKRLSIYGHVQGVGFRYSFAAVAKKEGVAGWVRNRQDGSVEAVIHGNKLAVQTVIDWVQQGPSMARVERVDVVDGNGEFSDFSIRESI